MPIAGIKTKPVTSVPTIAPVVFTVYNTLTLEPIALRLASAVVGSGRRSLRAALSSGSVIPIIAVGTTRIANEHSNRAIVNKPSDSGAARCSVR